MIQPFNKPPTGGPPTGGLPTGAILCGGSSLRMGRDKATLSLAGKPMIQWVAEALSAGGITDVVALGADPSSSAITVLPDREPGAGPLAALVGALERLGDLFVSPCDVPTLSPELVSQILTVAQATARPVVLAFSDRLEPLIGVYRAMAAPALRAALENGAVGPRQVLLGLIPGLLGSIPRENTAESPVEFVTVGTDVAHVCNVNEPSDLPRAQGLLH